MKKNIKVIAILLVLAVVLCVCITGCDPPYINVILVETSMSCLFKHTMYYNLSNIIAEDGYGRVLVSTYDLVEDNEFTYSDTLIYYAIYLASELYDFYKHLPKVYYYVAYEDNTDSEEFRQFLRDNHWGEELSATIDQYVSFGYPYHLMDRELLDSHEGFKYSEYVDGAYDYVKQNICADIVQLNTILSYKDYKLMSAYINKEDGNLYVVISDCNDLDNITYSNYLIRYDHFREDLESIKETVDWVNECKAFDKDWNCIYEQCMDAIRIS